jgi:MFS family permease
VSPCAVVLARRLAGCVRHCWATSPPASSRADLLPAWPLQVYTTRRRGTGSGIIAAASKLAGVFAPSLTAALADGWERLRGPAVVVLAVLLLGLATTAATAVETKQLTLAQIRERVGGTEPSVSAPSDTEAADAGPGPALNSTSQDNS